MSSLGTQRDQRQWYAMESLILNFLLFWYYDLGSTQKYTWTLILVPTTNYSRFSTYSKTAYIVLLSVTQVRTCLGEIGFLSKTYQILSWNCGTKGFLDDQNTICPIEAINYVKSVKKCIVWINLGNGFNKMGCR